MPENVNMEKCEICGVDVSSKSSMKHMKKIHFNEYIHNKFPPSKKREKNGLRNIILISQRGTRFRGDQECTNCNRIVLNPTKYSESNFGEVYLCALCKPKIRKKSFGKANIRFVSVVSGGKCG